MIILKSNNTHGLLNETVVKGKKKLVPNWDLVTLINEVDGSVISFDPSPKFQDWTFEDYQRQFHADRSVRFIEPMGAIEPDEYDPGELDIAELKHDGHRGLVYIGTPYNRIFSRRVSKKTGWFSENSDQVPHIRDFSMPDFKGTVLDGEFDYGTTSMGVQSVMGALPENAVQYQYENGFIPYVVFDILYYKGVNIQRMPLWKRKIYAAMICYHINVERSYGSFEFATMYMTADVYDTFRKLASKYIRRITEDHEAVLQYILDRTTVVDSYQLLFDEFTAQGLEGAIIKPLDGIYEPGKRSKAYLKMKGTSTWDVVMIGISEPERDYDGKRLHDGTLHLWEYWHNPKTETTRFTAPGTPKEREKWEREGFIPVSKPFAMGWCGGIVCGVYKPITDAEWESWIEDYGGETHAEAAFDQYGGLGETLLRNGKKYVMTEVTTVKGLTEEVMIDLKGNWQKYVEEHRVLEVKANGLIDKEIGSLRHPRFSRWRDDKSADQCYWEAHIREEE